ncbi:MAG TPA: lipoprotein insertase outer membrane protein LolB [Noviherbaspirillum sp.]|jgi:outer membrane lipoprotein LolB|uniref:lipoprotein insertase outer membrane protein LolB n=1 Tax=Noviherbaspirillum sp. TaxID=1926288 RepID=UPI002DDCBA62|nr:lipoprotein insertase outer membrane protein LolB [Noviherbaspirillum sp.]HEV2609898.1 lipoprotein insertase outer membrane protein LolB [Noviherbaspirillum sp.]
MRTCALLLALLTAGCASVAPVTGDAGRTDSPAQAPRSYADNIDLTGRISVRYQVNDKEEALHGGFTWTQNRDNTQVTLLSPLGQVIALIEIGRDGATLKQSGQPPRQAADVDALVEATLGWPLPISGLRDWLQGFAIDANGYRFIAQPPAAEVATRDGWRISYNTWQDTRPKRVDLERRTPQAGDVSIRLVIDTWQ